MHVALASVTITDGVLDISSGAFALCTKLSILPMVKEHFSIARWLPIDFQGLTTPRISKSEHFHQQMQSWILHPEMYHRKHCVYFDRSLLHRFHLLDKNPYAHRIVPVFFFTEHDCFGRKTDTGQFHGFGTCPFPEFLKFFFG